MDRTCAWAVARVGAVVCLLASAPWASAGDIEESRLVLRISPAALGQVQQKTFETEQAVDDLVLGTKVTGIAKTSAKCLFEACEEEQVSGLRLVVSGTSVTDTEGRNGPAIITSTTTTDFTATAPLRFSARDGFSAGEVEVEADTKTQTKGIRSTQGGIAGAFVKKLAEKKVKASQQEAQAIARKLAIKRIEGEVATELEARLAKLNAAYQHLNPMLALVEIDADEPVHVMSDAQGLLVWVGPRQKPDVGALAALQSSAELWLPAAGVDAALGSKLSGMTRSATFAVSVRDDRPVESVSDARPQLERSTRWWIVRSGAVQQD